MEVYNQTTQQPQRKTRVAVLFGGRSGEHEVSLMSAASVIKAMDKTKYEVIPIGITKDGRWLAGGDPLAIMTDGQARLDLPNPTQHVVQGSLIPEPGRNELLKVGQQDHGVAAELGVIDVVFPVLHGTYGEDGAIQGLLELADIPYVGAGVAGSAVGMDKALMKAVFRDAGLPMLDYVVVMRWELDADVQSCVAKVEERLSYPCFVKPANLGSSVGISKVRNRQELIPAFRLAALYDRKLVVEKGAQNVREVEISVLGNNQPKVSQLGEIIPANEFYDYDAKYKDDRSQLIIPARVSRECAQRVGELALKAFKACDCAGLARVDFFVDKASEEIWLNEINTMPGFTRISMYPKLWEVSGIPYSQLIDQLIQLALERYQDKLRSKTSYD
jgi:D-alanine-D-alanine ligase